MTKFSSIDQNTSPLEGGLGEDKKDQESQQIENETTQTTKETVLQLNELKKQLKKDEVMKNVEHSGERSRLDDANKFLETELEKIEVQTNRLESNEKESHTYKSKHNAKYLEAQQRISSNKILAHQAIEDLGRPEATQGLKDSYDESQNAVTDLMGMFLTGKNLGFFS